MNNQVQHSLLVVVKVSESMLWSFVLLLHNSVPLHLLLGENKFWMDPPTNPPTHTR